MKIRTGFMGLALATGFGLSLALVSGCNTEEAPPTQTPPKAGVSPAPKIDVKPADKPATPAPAPEEKKK